MRTIHPQIRFESPLTVVALRLLSVAGGRRSTVRLHEVILVVRLRKKSNVRNMYNKCYNNAAR